MSINMKMLAYCGLYCEQCSFKAAYDEQNDKHLRNIPYTFTPEDLSEYNCEGCKGLSICGPCKIKSCASAKGIESCAECNDLPCANIDAFSNNGMPHHENALENLYYIRKHGVDAWYEQLQPSLTCACAERQTWYYTCPLHKQDS